MNLKFTMKCFTLTEERMKHIPQNLSDALQLRSEKKLKRNFGVTDKKKIHTIPDHIL